VSSNFTQTSPSTPDDDTDLDWLFGEPEHDEIILAARRDHLVMLTQAACDAMVDLIRLKARLQERGDRLGPVDTFKWVDAVAELERARWCYASDLKHYDGPQVIYDAAERYAGATIALVLEGFMERWREIQWKEFLAAREGDRAESH
jgi:hypothetical protein